LLLYTTLAVALGALGLTVWLAKADYLLLPVLLPSVALLGLGPLLQRLRPR